MLTAFPGKNREDLREQHELTQEIGNAITSMPITEPVDEDELEADLAELEQEKLNEKMLGTTVPVGDSVARLPSVANGEGEFKPFPSLWFACMIRRSGVELEGFDFCSPVRLANSVL